jgi:aspartyl-tRNA(Asn)/glutamyl-tRNA(Gln) amidotransferase subunit C
MAIDDKIIEYTAQLAKLDLTDEEKNSFPEQLSEVLEFVEKINTLDTSGVEPTDHVLPNVNVMRDDVHGETLNEKQLNKNAPHFAKGHFVVPKIIE